MILLMTGLLLNMMQIIATHENITENISPMPLSAGSMGCLWEGWGRGSEG